jgi:hypothetical protein
VARTGLRESHYTSPTLAAERALDLIDKTIDRIIERGGWEAVALTLGILGEQREYVKPSPHGGSMGITRSTGGNRRQQALQLTGNVGDAYEPFTEGALTDVLELRPEQPHGADIQVVWHLSGVDCHQRFIDQRSELVSGDLGHR